MIEWLAQQQPAGVATVEWKDLGPFAAGVGTVLAALVAGWFLSRNSRKSPYERLEQLSKARAEWPEGLEGRESLDRSIDYALARIRSLEGPAIHVHLTAEARRANWRVANKHFTAACEGLAILVAASTAIPLLRWLWPLMDREPDPAFTAKMMMAITLGGVSFALYGLGKMAWHGSQWWRWRRHWRPSDPR